MLMKRLLSTRNDTCPLLRFQQSAKAHQSDQELTGKDGFLTLLIKQLTEDALSAPIWLRMWKPIVKMAQAKRPLKLPPALSNWQLCAIVMALLSHNL